METWELVARESIRDVVARYNCSGDNGRIDEMMSLFTPDAALEVPDREPLLGRDSIHHFFTSVATPGDTTFVLKSLHHHTATHQIDLVDEQSAKGRSYFAVLTQNGLDHWGRYVDEYRCEDGQWKIKNRKVYVDGLTPGGWGEMQIDN